MAEEAGAGGRGGPEAPPTAPPSAAPPAVGVLDSGEDWVRRRSTAVVRTGSNRPTLGRKLPIGADAAEWGGRAREVTYAVYVATMAVTLATGLMCIGGVWGLQFYNLLGVLKGTTDSWESKPFVDVMVVNASEGGCPAGYESLTDVVWPGTAGGPCVCAYGGSAQGPCSALQVAGGACRDAASLSAFETRAWLGEAEICARRGGAAALPAGQSARRPVPDGDGRCPKGYRKCGSGSDYASSYCFPSWAPACAIDRLVVSQNESAFAVGGAGGAGGEVEGASEALALLGTNLTLFVFRGGPRLPLVRVDVAFGGRMCVWDGDPERFSSAPVRGSYKGHANVTACPARRDGLESPDAAYDPRYAPVHALEWDEWWRSAARGSPDCGSERRDASVIKSCLPSDALCESVSRIDTCELLESYSLRSGAGVELVALREVQWSPDCPTSMSRLRGVPSTLPDLLFYPTVVLTVFAYVILLCVGGFMRTSVALVRPSLRLAFNVVYAILPLVAFALLVHVRSVVGASHDALLPSIAARCSDPGTSHVHAIGGRQLDTAFGAANVAVAGAFFTLVALLLSSCLTPDVLQLMHFCCRSDARHHFPRDPHLWQLTFLYFVFPRNESATPHAAHTPAQHQFHRKSSTPDASSSSLKYQPPSLSDAARRPSTPSPEPSAGAGPSSFAQSILSPLMQATRRTSVAPPPADDAAARAASTRRLVSMQSARNTGIFGTTGTTAGTAATGATGATAHSAPPGARDSALGSAGSTPDTTEQHTVSPLSALP